MKTVFVLPPESECELDFDNILETAREVFGEFPFRILAKRPFLSWYQTVVRGHLVEDYDDAQKPLECARVILVRSWGGRCLFETIDDVLPGTRVFVRRALIDETFALLSSRVDVEHDPRALDTYFGRVCAWQSVGFQYFPYGYTYRLPGLGPTNEFGFRVRNSLDTYKKRAPNQKLIAVFGGSAAWSIYVTYSAMFQQRLEDKLNQVSRDRGVDLTFVVLNLALPGNVLINEMINYLVFCQPLRPDLVIAHDGCNDLFGGLITDPHLVRKYSVTYAFQLEEWAKLLHRPKEEVQHSYIDPMNFRPCNYPRHSVGAYIERQKQFRMLVEAAGGRFLVGLQGMIYSKRERSRLEKQVVNTYNPQLQEAYRCLPYAYSKYQEHLDRAEIEHFVDFHARFGRMDGSTTHFGDTMHTTRAGDEAIAEAYEEYIVHKFLPGWIQEVERGNARLPQTPESRAV